VEDHQIILLSKPNWWIENLAHIRIRWKLSNPFFSTLHANITREEIRLTIQLHIVSMFRCRFLREELDKIITRIHGTSNDNVNSNNGLTYDRNELREAVNSKLKAHRSLISIDGILYKCATTIDEYCNLVDIEKRVNEVIMFL
jgi:hypothetical protein